MKRLLMILASVVAVCIGVGILVAIVAPKSKPTATASSSNQAGAAAPAAANAPASTLYAVGQDVKVGDVRWKVLEAKDAGNTLPKTDITKEKKSNGKYVIVRIEVENQSKDGLSFSSVDIKDDQDRTFQQSTDFDVSMHIPTDEHCTLEQLNANLPKTCTMIYEVPASAKGFKANVGDLKAFTNDDAWIDLGF